MNLKRRSSNVYTSARITTWATSILNENIKMRNDKAHFMINSIFVLVRRRHRHRHRRPNGTSYPKDDRHTCIVWPHLAHSAQRVMYWQMRCCHSLPDLCGFSFFCGRNLLSNRAKKIHFFALVRTTAQLPFHCTYYSVLCSASAYSLISRILDERRTDDPPVLHSLSTVWCSRNAVYRSRLRAHTRN